MSLFAPNVDIPALKTQIDSKRFSIAIFALVIYELTLTMDDTVNLFVLQGRRSIFKILFFINRTAVLLITITINALNFVSFESDYSCLVTTWVEFVLSIFIISIVAFTLASRVYALWKGYRVVLTCFFLVLSANILNYLFIYGSALYRGTPIVSQLPYTGCAYVLNSNILWIVFANTLTFEAISITLIIYKAWPVARQRGIETPVFSLLLEDGVAYYLIFTASKLFTVGAIYVPTPISFVVLSSYPSVPVAALAINSLFIRLQRIMVHKPAVSDFTSTNFSVVKYGTSSGSGSSGRNEVNTVGGTGPVGRIRARRYQQGEVFSGGDIEMSSPEEVYILSTRPDTSLNRPATGESIANTIEPKPRHVV